MIRFFRVCLGISALLAVLFGGLKGFSWLEDNHSTAALVVAVVALVVLLAVMYLMIDAATKDLPSRRRKG